MKLRGIYLGFALTLTLTSMAAPLSPEEALSRASDGGAMRLSGKTPSSPELLMTMKTSEGEASLYVFSKNAENGYMILSADDQIVPVLGYSDEGVFDKNNIAPGLRYWLNEYSRQIEYARQQNVASEGTPNVKFSLPSSWENLGPLMKTQWNQDAPYNNLCPSDNGANSYTGCVATSISQVMNYHKYPEKGFGQISYSCVSLGKRLSLNFSDITFDWDNMLDNYVSGNYTDEEANAVATLMMAAGYAVEMEYSSSFSGAVSGRIPGALISYFGYDKGARYYDRSDYSYEDWASMIHQNLKDGMPVILDGSSPSEGGHSFVCDGYASGYFHINWGWGGSSDGYYLLDALTPSSIGIGGAAGGFNFDQDGVFYIKPETPGSTSEPQSTIFQYGTLTGSVTSSGILTLNTIDAIYLGYGYQGNQDGIFSFGAGFVKNDSPNDTPTYLTSNNLGNVEVIPAAFIPFDNAMNRPKFTLAYVDLEDGVTYRVISAFKPMNGEWQTMKASRGAYNYILLTKNGSSYEVTNMPTMEFESNGITVNTKLYEGNSVEVTTTLTNNNDIELSRGVGLVLMDKDDNIVFYGESFLLTLEARKSKKETWATVLTATDPKYSLKGDTEFYLGLQDLETTVIYYKSDTPVVMEPNPGAPRIVASITIEGAEKSSDLQGEYYLVENGNNFNVTTDIEVTRGYFSFDVTLHVLQIMPSNPNYLESLMRLPYGISFIEADESASMTINVNYPGETNHNYFLQTAYNAGGSLTWMNDQVRFKINDFLGADPDAGIEEINMNSSDIRFIHDRVSGHISVIGGEGGIVSVNAYYLNGNKAPVKITSNNGQKDVDLNSLGKGILILKATDKNGNARSIKVVL